MSKFFFEGNYGNPRVAWTFIALYRHCYKRYYKRNYKDVTKPSSSSGRRGKKRERNRRKQKGSWLQLVTRGKNYSTQLILIFRQKKSIGSTKEQDLHDIFSTVGGYSRLRSWKLPCFCISKCSKEHRWGSCWQFCGHFPGKGWLSKVDQHQVLPGGRQDQGQWKSRNFCYGCSRWRGGNNLLRRYRTGTLQSPLLCIYEIKIQGEREKKRKKVMRGERK